MADYSEFFDPIRVRRWQSYVEGDADLESLLREATGHAVAMRDAIAAGDERVHPGDRALFLVAVLNRTRAAAGLSD